MDNLNEHKKIARIAGEWYLLMAVTAGFGLMFIKNSIFIDASETLTVENILRNEFGFVMAIISSMIAQICFIFLVLTLHKLFKEVNKFISQIMVALVLVSVAITFSAIILATGALVVLKTDYLNGFTVEQIHSIAMTFLGLYYTGINIACIFWGLWLFPLGYLAYKSNFIPKIIGILLFISGVCYCVDSLSYFINPALISTLSISPSLHKQIVNIFIVPKAIGEVAMILWLLIKGVSVKGKVN
jgi:hypothetical protein